MKTHRGAPETNSSLQSFDQFIWQIPLLGFLIYFVYFYLQSKIWLFNFSFVIYFYINVLILDKLFHQKNCYAREVQINH